MCTMPACDSKSPVVLSILVNTDVIDVDRSVVRIFTSVMKSATVALTPSSVTGG